LRHFLRRGILATLLLSLLLLYVWERVDIVRLGYHVERLKARKLAMQRERDELQVKLSTLTAPDRLARAATDRLGMMPPQPGQVVLVKIQPRATPGTEPALPTLRMAKVERKELRP